MKTRTPVITYVISGPTAGTVRAAREIAVKQIAPDKVGVDVYESMPNGITKTRQRPFLVKDYFSNIDVLSCENDGTDNPAFKIVFHVRKDAGSFWKDVISRVLKSVEELGAVVSVVRG